MYNMKVVKQATKVSSVKNIVKGSVLIKTKSDVTLDATSYKKRERIFEKGKWIGTKPIVIGSNDTKSCVNSNNTKSNLALTIYNRKLALTTIGKICTNWHISIVIVNCFLYTN